VFYRVVTNQNQLGSIRIIINKNTYVLEFNTLVFKLAGFGRCMLPTGKIHRSQIRSHPRKTAKEASAGEINHTHLF
jgi:hypothetical protein